MRTRIDAGPVTLLPVCSCGWRGLPALTRGEALAQARHHERRAHPGSEGALRALNNHRRRHGISGADTGGRTLGT